VDFSSDGKEQRQTSRKRKPKKRTEDGAEEQKAVK
jgi:hypothetical protein